MDGDWALFIDSWDQYSLVFKDGGHTKEGWVTQENSGPTKLKPQNLISGTRWTTSPTMPGME